MLGKSHMLTGAAGWCAIGAPVLEMTGTHVTPATLVAGSVACAGGCVLPDLDHPQATLARSLGPVTHVLSKFVNKISGGHRMGTHSILGVVITALLLGALVALPAPWPEVGIMVFCTSLAIRVLTDARGLECFGLAAVIGSGLIVLDPNPTWLVTAITLGCVLHICGDMLTAEGAPLLYPFSGKRFRLPVIRRTGNRVEMIIAGIAGLWAAYAMITGVMIPVYKAETKTAVAQPAKVAHGHHRHHLVGTTADGLKAKVSASSNAGQ